MNFLIVKTSALGDIIQTFPVLDYFREYHPRAHIDWVVEKPFAEILEAHPYVDHVIAIESKKWRKNLNSQSWSEFQAFKEKLQEKQYDAVFDLQGNTKSGLVTFLAKAKDKVGFAYKTVAEWPNILVTGRRFNPNGGINIRDDYMSIVQQYFNAESSGEHPTKKLLLRLTPNENQQVNDILAQPEIQTKPRFMFCPGSAWENKRIATPVLIDIAKKVKEEMGGSLLWVWGNDAERKEAEELHGHFKANSVIVPKLSIPMLQHLMDRIELVFAVDSLPLHLAGTTSTSTFSVFGPSMGLKYAPQGYKHMAFQGECPYNRDFIKRCPVLRTCPTGACIKQMDAGDIYFMFSMIAGSVVDSNHLRKKSVIDSLFD